MILVGDNRERLRELGDATIDAVVTDPPYELGFMGKKWDSTGIAYSVELWREVLRVLKPGGHLLAFGGSRTYHRLACAIEDAGFEIRDMIEWVYGSGFPKSLDVSKAIDKMHGAEREVVSTRPQAPKFDVTLSGGTNTGYNRRLEEGATATFDVTAPATDDAKRWSGWGTALKPAHEPIVLARKPLDGTVAETVLAHGTGGLNIDGCRVVRADGDISQAGQRTLTFGHDDEPTSGGDGSGGWSQNDAGRWPANFIHDGSDEVLELFPETAGGARPAKANKPTGEHYEGGWGPITDGERIEFAGGSAARFFYCAKASRSEREAGLDALPKVKAGSMSGGEETRADRPTNHTFRHNHHPTVKPVALMRYLVRLVTPPGGVVLDPFTGSGTTGIAARLEGCEFLGIELSPDYAAIAEARIAHAA